MTKTKKRLGAEHRRAPRRGERTERQKKYYKNQHSKKTLKNVVKPKRNFNFVN
jgi:hypothetical protein